MAHSDNGQISILLILKVFGLRRMEDTPLSVHIHSRHGGSTENLFFKAIDQVKTLIRGGDLDQKLLQKESEWIFRLKSQRPDGLNDALNFACFL